MRRYHCIFRFLYGSGFFRQRVQSVCINDLGNIHSYHSLKRRYQILVNPKSAAYSQSASADRAAKLFCIHTKPVRIVAYSFAHNLGYSVLEYVGYVFTAHYLTYARARSQSSVSA